MLKEVRYLIFHNSYKTFPFIKLPSSISKFDNKYFVFHFEI